MTEPYDRYRPDETQDTQHYRPNLQKGADGSASDAPAGSGSWGDTSGDSGTYPSYPPLPEYGVSQQESPQQESPQQEFPQQGFPQYGTQQYGQPNPYASNPYASNPYAPPPFGGWVDPSAPYGRHQQTGEPYGEKSKVVAGLLQLVPLVFALPLGIGRFYMGTNAIAIAQLSVFVVGVLLCLTIIGIVFGLPLLVIGWLWCLVDGIVVLAGTPRDGAGRLLRP
ncbi:MULTISPECIES: TM2 domain-containing protein [Nocardiaceae]|uniref:TM2 domain-containing protein n=1 Tax=Rhodococcoides kroppenstedtii TaxID=293050 RepID=A0ABS7NWA8_9NOCA|nr:MULTISPECIES: TM2 domain-containing protein [Rhodococcus]AMY19288.1 hypothetical protein A3Q40_01908 [Rhodococcus sp. PBTS 1]MBY6314514.1 hypothetical protein [Rhodococcus kroppenstedtii]MBY6322321.1 hypothetical protein [Rhodococcus kroppenstedtii]MBY6401184.1 hypothetical protein [Rhodococcus kroppenstedtii]